MHGIYAHARVDDLDLDARSNKNQRRSISTTKQATHIKLATTIGHFVYVTLTRETLIWLDHLCPLLLLLLSSLGSYKLVTFSYRTAVTHKHAKNRIS